MVGLCYGDKPLNDQLLFLSGLSLVLGSSYLSARKILALGTSATLSI